MSDPPIVEVPTVKYVMPGLLEELLEFPTDELLEELELLEEFPTDELLEELEELLEFPTDEELLESIELEEE